MLENGREVVDDDGADPEPELELLPDIPVSALLDEDESEATDVL